jgi:hypothetical protein
MFCLKYKNKIQFPNKRLCGGTYDFLDLRKLDLNPANKHTHNIPLSLSPSSFCELLCSFAMENLYFYLVLFLSTIFIIKVVNHRSKNLPPSPFSLPIIGHLHLLKQPLFQELQTLSLKYGPILSLKFGSRSILVVSSPSVVEECFTKNDIIFANRPRIMAGDHFTYNSTTLVWAPYGHLWRNLRRVANIEIFSNINLQKSSISREEEVYSFSAKYIKFQIQNPKRWS